MIDTCPETSPTHAIDTRGCELPVNSQKPVSLFTDFGTGRLTALAPSGILFMVRSSEGAI
jgi:hypothetical protein